MSHYYPSVMLFSLIAGISILRFVAVATKSPGRRNVTIDDHFGDEMTRIVPTYVPSDRWIDGGINLPPVALAKPNASLAHDGTWHDSTHLHLLGATTTAVNFNFTGVSIYVYCIVANMPPGIFLDSFADYKFVIDGELVGKYTHKAENIPDYFYNVPVYVNTSLENGYHNFSIIVDSTEHTVLILFDYAIYTVIDENSANASTSTSTQTFTTDPLIPSQSTHAATSNLPTGTDAPDVANASRNTGLIVGATLAGLSIFVLMGTLIYHRRQKVTRSSPQQTSQQWRRSRFLQHSKPWPPALDRHTEGEKVARTPIHSPVRGSEYIESKAV